MPMIAELDERGDRLKLQRMLTKVARGVLLATVPCALVLFVFAHPILHVFGAGYDAAALPLRILCVAQLVNVLTGFGGTIVIMVRRSDLATRGVAGGAVVNVVLSPILISLYGISGAAAASAVGIVVTNLLITRLLWSSHRLYAPAIRVPGRAKQAPLPTP
jgi:O-antigen/teichoic acid export membrane protein